MACNRRSVTPSTYFEGGERRGERRRLLQVRQARYRRRELEVAGAVTHDKIRFERRVQALVRVDDAVAHTELGRRFTIAIVATEAIVVPPDDARLGRSPSAPLSRSVSQ